MTTIRAELTHSHDKKSAKKEKSSHDQDCGNLHYKAQSSPGQPCSQRCDQHEQPGTERHLIFFLFHLRHEITLKREEKKNNNMLPALFDAPHATCKFVLLSLLYKFGTLQA